MINDKKCYDSMQERPRVKFVSPMNDHLICQHESMQNNNTLVKDVVRAVFYMGIGCVELLGLGYRLN